MEYNTILEILATLITLIGITIISIPKRFGLYILVLGAILWILFAYSMNYNFLLFQSVYVLFFDGYGIYSWKKKGIN